MYIYHKQCEIMQKIQWNSSNGQLHWFPIEFLWNSSKMDQNYANANAPRTLANFFKRYPDMPYESWRPGDFENVMVFYAIFFKPELLLPKVGSNLQNFFCKIVVSQKISTPSKKFSSQILLREVSKLNLKTSLRRIWLEIFFWAHAYFLWNRIILRTNSKFQTPLTLNSHKSGL